MPLERYRFTVDEYHRLAETGILGEEDRVELIDGEIVMMTPMGSRHAACLARLTQLLVELADGAAIVRVQSPVELDGRSEPEPDLALARPRADFYTSGHPRPADLLLVVEVADSSLGYDRDVKLPLYGTAGVPELWIVDLGRGCVDAYRGPFAGGYAERRTYRRGERVEAVGIALGVPVDDVLPD